MPTLKTVLEMDITAFRARAEEANAIVEDLAKATAAATSAPTASKPASSPVSATAAPADAAAGIASSADTAANKVQAAANKISQSVKKAGDDAVAAAKKGSAAAETAAGKSVAASSGAAQQSKAAAAETGRTAQQTGEKISKAAGGVSAISGALGGINPQIGAIGQAVSALATGPIGWVTAAVSGLVAMFAYFSQKAQDALNSAIASAKTMRDLTAKKNERTDENSRKNQSYFDRLVELDAKPAKSESALNEMADLVEYLNAQYKNLGLTIDATSGKVENLAEKQNEAVKQDYLRSHQGKIAIANEEAHVLQNLIRGKLGDVDGFEDHFKESGYKVRGEIPFVVGDAEQAADVASGVTARFAKSSSRAEDEKILNDFLRLQSSNMSNDDQSKLKEIIDALTAYIDSRDERRKSAQTMAGESSAGKLDFARKRNEAEESASERKKAEAAATRGYWDSLTATAQTATGNTLGVAVAAQIQKTKDYLGRDELSYAERTAAEEIAVAAEALQTSGNNFRGETTQASIPNEIAAVGGWDSAIERRDPYDVNVAMLEQQRLANELLAVIARNKSNIVR